ncbi:branched-chain amino acid ABC transporter permease [Cellulosilyticum lentocellum]|uniref:ABC-type transporter, integral membrane subunit n=1 Tax=Cellulosilyticum lentocellum (strain ATCC 49066 / DSM 5427 / NCIMB 11756 / RHM5) TaxID=642492 RepID=F2JLB8_CELLD|nr:branched-chain amino acid ABC transporter permease [Cellulosilyticum lentocellum]ADZ82206.1 ABC-type transporter, integral membrane subunit [Cellulosilyticum lentocellum DSM 5427]
MTLEIFLQQLVNGLTLGSLFALVAIGYTMVYGILRLINFAHGDIFMMAMYIAFFSISIFSVPWYISFILVIALTALLGIATEKVAYKPLREQGAPSISLLISSIGASYLMENLATVLFTGRPKNFPQIPFFTDMITVGGIHIQRLAIMVPIITLVLLLALLYLINHTKTGMAMRAVSKDVETARLMGISVNKVITATFGIGSALAAVGAIMWGMKYLQIKPDVGVMPGMKCFIAAVIGGIGNIKGAVVGGLLLGLIEVLIVAFIPSLTGYRDAFSFILLIIILLVRPNGLIGEKIAEKV